MKDKNIVVQIAQKTIELAFDNQDLDMDIYTSKYPWLKDNGASFVTLMKNKQLRGCIGSLIAQRPLIEDIIANAINAAFKDPRFPKLSKDELNIIDIEVSILSDPKKVEYTDVNDLKNKITPLKDGVILKLGANQATFLPQVWEELAEFETFFGHLLHKAGLPMDSFKYHPEIYTYQVEKYKS